MGRIRIISRVKAKESFSQGGAGLGRRQGFCHRYYGWGEKFILGELGTTDVRTCVAGHGGSCCVVALGAGSCWFKWGAGVLAEELSQIGSTRRTWWWMSPRASCREPAVSFKIEDAKDGSEGGDGITQGGHERLITLEFGIGDTENVAKHAVARVVTYVDQGAVAGAKRKNAERAFGNQVGIVDRGWTSLAAASGKTVAH